MFRHQACLLATIALCAACRSTRDSGALDRHFQGPVWIGALEQQSRQPGQWAPTAALVLALPIAAFDDHELSDDAADHGVTADTHTGDVLSLALGGGALAWGGMNWANGDQGASFEVAAESLVVTAAATQSLKRITHRHRPGGSASHSSFPSGHTSFAFAGATFLAREIEAQTGSMLGYGLYVPAAVVALNRVENERHWPSDVIVGAALGIFVTNWIYNAHFPEEKSQRPTIFKTRPKLAWGFGPTLLDDQFALELTFAF